MRNTYFLGVQAACLEDSDVSEPNRRPGRRKTVFLTCCRLRALLYAVDGVPVATGQRKSAYAFFFPRFVADASTIIASSTFWSTSDNFLI